MDLEKIKKYLEVYLDEVITPKLNRELVGEDDEPITVKIHDIKQKEHSPYEAVVFLDMEPDWSGGSILHSINNDILRFLLMLGYKKFITVAWNKRPEPIYEPK